MFVKYYMSENPVTIAYDATISQAITIMNDTKVHRLPVMKDGKLVGIITDGNIQKATPTKATSLSMYEVNYLLSKATVADYMTKNVVTCESGILLEQAVSLMKDEKVSCLPVVDDGKLVGIITETDVFDALIELLGFENMNSTRVTIDIREDKVGVLARLTLLMKQNSIGINNVAVYRDRSPIQVVMDLQSTDVDLLTKIFEEDDFKVSHTLVRK